MTELDRSLRIRAFLETWLPVFVALFVIVTAASGFWIYQVYFVPEIEEEQRTVTQWSESTEYEHSAVIVNDSIPFEVGERVTNRPVYYTALADDLDVTYRYEYTAESGTVQVSTEMFLLFRGVEGDDVLWESREPLATGTTDLSPGENQTVSVSVNIDSVFETISTIEEQLGAAGTTEIIVVSLSNVEGEVEGQEVSHSYESTMPITVNPETFRVLEIETIDEQHQQVETVTIETEPSLTEQLGSILALVLSLVGLIGLLAGRYSGYFELSTDERELLELYQQEQEFEEWITTGTFPSERDYEATVLVDDLEGLVDVAIDTNKRVIKDEQLGVSTVLDNDYVYVYIRPDSPASDWLVNYADMTMDEVDEFNF